MVCRVDALATPHAGTFAVLVYVYTHTQRERERERETHTHTHTHTQTHTPNCWTREPDAYADRIEPTDEELQHRLCREPASL